jgi:hypothetical protein
MVIAGGITPGKAKGQEGQLRAERCIDIMTECAPNFRKAVIDYAGKELTETPKMNFAVGWALLFLLPPVGS